MMPSYVNGIDIEQYLPLAKKVSNVMAPKIFNQEKDDLYQEACVALIKAAKSYDKSKNASFKTYADMIIKKRILDANRKWTHCRGAVSGGKNKKYTNTKFTFCEFVDYYETDCVDTDNILSGVIYSGLKRSIAWRSLSERERFILNNYGIKIDKEIAKDLGISQTVVVLNRQNAIKKLRNYYKVDEVV